MNALPPFFMVFDVESVGLHGEGFAFGYVVLNTAGQVCDSDACACPADAAMGEPADLEWVRVNCPPLLAVHTHPHQVRRAFWNRWQDWKRRGAVLVADSPGSRTWEGPYPLHDVASVLLAHGRNPLVTHDRRPDELPVHDPLADARQSARILAEFLDLRPRA